MENKEKSIFLLSDINLDFLKRNIELTESNGIHSVSCSEYNEYKKIFLSNSANKYFDNSDYLFIWQSPEAVSEAFIYLKNFESFDETIFYKDLNNYIDRIKELSERFKVLLLPLLTSFDELSDLGIGNMNTKVGYNNFIHKANSIIIDELCIFKNIYLIDSSTWFKQCQQPFDFKLWLRAKIPFSIQMMKLISNSIISSIKTINGIQKKLLILDLDNTLWGGIVGDDGWENIKLGGHDVIGEAYLAFQKEIKKLHNRGVLLALCSKNEESIVRKAFEKNKYMHLKLDDFCSIQINWKSKSENIIEIAKETNLGVDSFVFIDDSAYERDAVSRDLDNVFVADFPEDVTLLPIWINKLDSFNTLGFGKEDINRNNSMQSEKRKNLLKLDSNNLEDWIESLNLKVSISSIKSIDLSRTFQLVNKTNQMNLHTNRYLEKDFELLINSENSMYMKVNIEDKFSSNELMGIIGLEISNEKISITDFILSCRAFGKNIEHTMVEGIKITAKSLNKSILQPIVNKTEKNIVCQSFFKNIDLKENIKPNTEVEKGLFFDELRTTLKINFD